jgi:cold shock CspA family protein
MSVIDRILGRKPQAKGTGGSSSRTARLRGTVKWWNDAKGYEFLLREDGADVFVHHTFLQCEGFKTFEQGEEVATGNPRRRMK